MLKPFSRNWTHAHTWAWHRCIRHRIRCSASRQRHDKQPACASSHGETFLLFTTREAYNSNMLCPSRGAYPVEFPSSGSLSTLSPCNNPLTRTSCDSWDAEIAQAGLQLNRTPLAMPPPLLSCGAENHPHVSTQKCYTPVFYGRTLPSHHTINVVEQRPESLEPDTNVRKVEQHAFDECAPTCPKLMNIVRSNLPTRMGQKASVVRRWGSRRLHASTPRRVVYPSV